MPFYDVNSSAYLVTFFVFALLETLLCSGITYGWASIVVVFKQEYFYMNLCRDWYKKHNETFPTPSSSSGFKSFFKNRTMVGGGAGYYSNGELPGCPIQDARLNLIFTVALFCLCGIKFPAGLFIDWGGPRIARVVGGTIYVIAALGLGFVAIGYENFLFPIFACISMGGSLLVVSVYQVSNIIFRTSRSRVMCILHGAFDSSAVFLLVFKLIYENGVPFRYIMYGYSAVCLVIIALGTFVLIPPVHVLFRWVDEENEMTNNIHQGSIAVGPDFVVRSHPNYGDFAIYSVNYGSCGEKNDTKEDTELKSRQPVEYNPMDTDDEEENAEDKNYNLPNKDSEVLIKSIHKSSRFPRGSVLRSIFSALYLLELVYLITFQLKLWYFVGSLPDFLERIAKNKENTVSTYVNLFGYIQFGGIIVTPIIGFVFERENMTTEEKVMLTPAEHRLKKLRSCILPFALTNVLCITFCVVSALEDLRAQIASYVLYTTVRGFLYANHGSYMGIAFPASQFGTLYGLGIFIGGCFGVLQYALFEFTSNVLLGNPFWTNMLLLLLSIIGAVHPIYLWWYCRQEAKRLSKQRYLTTKTYTEE